MASLPLIDRLRILHLEDDPDYSEFVRDMLQAEGLEVEVFLVCSRADYETALLRETFDLILADYLLPGYNALKALEKAREDRPEVPFVILSGTIHDQLGIESLKAGATDYVLKQAPERLAPAVRRALQENSERAERRRVQHELARRERFFRNLTENTLDLFVIVDSHARLRYVSPSLQRVLGYDPASLPCTCGFDLVHPDDLGYVSRGFEQLLCDPALLLTLEFRVRHADGSWRHIETVGQNRLGDEEIDGILINARDITDRVAAEHSLRESEKHYRVIFDGNPIPMWVFDHENLRILEVNDSALQHYGYSRDEFLAMTVKDLRPGEECPALVEYLHRLLPADSPNLIGAAGIWKHRKKDGSLIDVELKWSRISFQGRNASLAMANDITARRRTEHRDAALSKLGQKLSSATSPGEAAHIIRSIADDLFRWDAFTLDLCSAQEDRMYPLLNVDTMIDGRKVEVALGGQPHHPSQLARDIIEHGARLILREETTVMPEGITPFGDVSRPSASLALAPIRNHMRVIGVLSVQSYTLNAYTHQDLGILQMLADHCAGALERIRAEQALKESLTAQKRLEEQFRQAQKMEGIGQLAGGVAHDFNNILTVIHGHASLLQATGKLEGVAARSAEQIVEAAERAATLTTQLLTFSRRRVLQARRLDLNKVVDKLTQMLGRILGEDIALQLNYLPEPATVHADHGMIEQVLLNLAVNSRDAMPQGGVLNIQISTRTVTGAEAANDPEALAGDFVCLGVTDSGCGIPPENLRRIFEPFFTTKQAGKGTGLGLATVYGIVKQHRGWIQVESEVGHGTTFRVFLPQVETAIEAPEADVATPDVRGGKETILVVEDEGPVRELVCHLLTCHGYNILQAESGVRALEIWQEARQEIDLLLTDLVMPDRMNGRELAEKLWRDRPKLKVIFTSGYSADVVGRDFLCRSGLQYLQKPYPPQKLASVVRDCLDAVK